MSLSGLQCREPELLTELLKLEPGCIYLTGVVFADVSNAPFQIDDLRMDEGDEPADFFAAHVTVTHRLSSQVL